MDIIQPQINWLWGWRLIITAGTFFILCWLVSHSQRFNEFEIEVQHHLRHQQTNWWWHFIARVFDPKLIVIWDFCLAGYLLLIDLPTRAVFVIATLGTVDAFGILVKHLVKRGRPDDFGQEQTTYSFPSGHTLGTTMMVLMINMVINIWWLNLLLIVIWLMVVYCRLTLRAHYPADVVGALLLAYSWLISAEWLYILIMR